MSITKSEALRQTEQENTLCRLGFTTYEAQKLRRISMTLQRWHEKECGIDGGCIERDEKTDKPYWRSEYSGRLSPVADLEKGAKKRLGHILGLRNTREWVKAGAASVKEVAINAYIQTDPRGAALYLLRPNDISEGLNAESCYSRGICVY